MKIVTCNVNGIRSAFNKGFFDWFKSQRADILCLQELKAQPDQIDLKTMFTKNTFSYLKCAEKKDIAEYQFILGKNPIKLYMNTAIKNLIKRGDILKQDLVIFL